MADLKQLKAKPLVDFRESDPLAELTRIMGLSSQSSEDGAMDDFGIDLERELLGDFGDAEPAAMKDAPATRPDEDMFIDEDHVVAEVTPHHPAVTRAEHSSVEVRPRGEAIMTSQPARPALRVVDHPANSHETGSSSGDQSLEDELEALLSMDAAGEVTSGQPEAVPADVVEPQDRDDPLDRLEAFSKDWFARRRAQHEDPRPEPEKAVAGDDLSTLDEIDDLALADEDLTVEPQDAPVSYVDEVPVEAETFVAHDVVRPEESEAELEAEAVAMAPAPRSEPEPDLAPAPVAASPRPAFDPSADPFADLMAMGRPAPAADQQTPVDVVKSEPPAASAPDVRRTWATSREGPRYVAAAPMPEAEAPELEANIIPAPEQPAAEAEASVRHSPVAPSRFSIGRVAAPRMPVAAPVETAPAAPAVEPFESMEPEQRVEADEQEVAVGDDTFQDDDFDLGHMLETELAAEAEQIALRANPAPQPGPTEPAALGHAARQPIWGDFGEPDIDTVEVPVTQVDVAHEFDIPDLVFEDEPSRPGEQDELDLEFASAFEDLSSGRRIEPASYEPRKAFAAAAPADFSAAPAASQNDRMHARTAVEAEYPIDDLEGFWDEAQETDGYAIAEPETGQVWADDVYGEAPHDPGNFPSAFYADGPAEAAEPAPRRRRGLAIAAVVAGLAVAGGIGAFMLSFGSGGDDAAPVLVQVDPTPVKVRPEKPGGTIIPNEDKAVYDRVASGGENAAPAQEKLLSASEEPIDIAPKAAAVEADTSLPGVESPLVEEGEPVARAKAEDRVEQEIVDDTASPADEIASVAPRKVRTLIVRPDGTLVPREEPVAAEPQEPVRQASLSEPAAVPAATFESTSDNQAAAPAAEPEATQPPPAGVIEKPASQEVAAPAAAAAPETASNDVAAEPAPAAGTPETAPVRVVESKSFKPAGGSTPDRGPVAPARPSDQPVEIVGSAGGNAQRGTQVAAAAPATAHPPAIPAAPAGGWSMQIASQPSPEGAQKSYVDLAQRYGSILGGRGVNIVKADIAGKGTFWRVRIPAQSKAEAVELCERFKAAGGSCFIAK